MKAFNTTLKKRLEGRLGNLLALVVIFVLTAMLMSPYGALKVVGAALTVVLAVVTIMKGLRRSRRDKVRDTAIQTQIDEAMASTARAKLVLLRLKEEDARRADEVVHTEIPDSWK